MKKIVVFIKNEAVMLLSLLLALVSMVFVVPSADYIDYIDFRSLSLLFCLMAVMAGFNKLGVFKIFAEKLLRRVFSVRGIILTMVLLCFFSSMIITNDVSLITFVPFTIITLKLADKSEKIILTVVLETVAANLGSMLTPIGNPQNLYLFSKYDMNISDFFITIFPYAIVSFILLVIFSTIFGKEKININNRNLSFESDKKTDVKLLVLYITLFIISLAGVFRLINHILLLIIVVAFVLVFDKKTILNIDYSLLLTFVFLFIFIGNLGKIPSINSLLSSTVNGNEVITGVVSSQVFSNVPATILLSGFTQNYKALLVGVNLGGLGTLIASMASLISFKFIQKENVGNCKYLICFSLVNIIFLIFTLGIYIVIG